jgi:hypothetical protein
MTDASSMDPVERIASKQVEWKSLDISSKIPLLEQVLEILRGMDVDQFVELLGNTDAEMMGYRPHDTIEGQYEAVHTAFLYAVNAKWYVSKMLDAYRTAAATGKKAPPRWIVKTTTTTTTTTDHDQSRTIVQTLPILPEDKFGPMAKCKGEVWLQPGAEFRSFQVPEFLNNKEINDNQKGDGCMVVLAAGNHCFLSLIDCLHGLFQCNHTVYLKHHPIRIYHDTIIRHILQPLIQRGYMDTETNTSIERTKQIIYHPTAVARVHLTGGKATHDAIVWGDNNTSQRIKPILKATMTSELGCVTPWIIATQTKNDKPSWTHKQLKHQVQTLFWAMYNNAGANCNSPKVIVMPKSWPHAKEFVQLLCQEMEQHPLPVAYYPGSRERWNQFQNMYDSLAKTYGDASPQTIEQRHLQPHATVLPWLVIDGIHVNLTTESGRKQASTEYAFRTEPFAPVVTIAYIEEEEDLDVAVQFCNEYLFGSLSCTLVTAADASAPEIQRAVANLRYGGIAINAWSALCYFATGTRWGAYPGETLENVESGIGQIQNCFFIPDIEKFVFYSPLIDVGSHQIRKRNLVAAKNEIRAVCTFLLRPGAYNFFNLITASIFGVELPRGKVFYGVFAAAMAGCTACWVQKKAK